MARAAEQLTLVLVAKNRQRSGVQESDAPFRIDHVKRVRDAATAENSVLASASSQSGVWAHGHSRTSAVVGEGRVAALTDA